MRADQARNTSEPCSGIQTLSKSRDIMGVFIQEDDMIRFAFGEFIKETMRGID